MPRALTILSWLVLLFTVGLVVLCYSVPNGQGIGIVSFGGAWEVLTFGKYLSVAHHDEIILDVDSAYISGVMMIPPTIYLAVRMVRVRRRRMPGFQVIQSDKSGKS